MLVVSMLISSQIQFHSIEAFPCVNVPSLSFLLVYGFSPIVLLLCKLPNYYSDLYCLYPQSGQMSCKSTLPDPFCFHDLIHPYTHHINS